MIAGAGLGCRVIATEHTHPPSQVMSGFWQRAAPLDLSEGRARGGADKRHHSLDRNACAGSRLAVIPNPVHWPLPQAEPRKQPEPRPGRRRLLAVGRLQDKGFDLLIQAFKQLASAHPDWDLVILGEGGERAALEAQLRQSGCRTECGCPAASAMWAIGTRARISTS